MNKIEVLTMTAGMAAILGGAPAIADDGAALYAAKICATCHGADGKAPIMPPYPKLAGQSSDYCLQQTIDIRDGKRTGGLTVVMQGVVASVTDEEFKTMCDWLATQ